MENTANFVLSDYQRAVLNEMGISSWQLANGPQTPFENQTYGLVDASSTATSKMASKIALRTTPKEEALDRLKQLKAQTQTRVTSDLILVTLPDVNFQIFTDVLIALGLETKQQKYVSIEQLSQFSGYSLSWTQGEKVSFKYKQLTTPALAELHRPDIKKLLWQQLYSASSGAKN